MSVITPVRRLLSAVVAASTLVVGAPFLVGVAHATHSVSTIAPQASLNNRTTRITVNGTGFLPTSSVRLERVNDRSDDIAGAKVVQSSGSSQLVADFNLALANPGVYDVIVSQPGESDQTCNPSACFTVLRDLNPAVTDVAPDTSTGARNDLIISGYGFTKSSNIKFLLPGTQTVDPGVTFTRTSVPDSTTMKGTYVVDPATVTPGLHDVGLYDPDTGGLLAVCGGCYKQPVITGTSPNQLGQGATAKDITITGAGLSGSAISFSGSGITIVSQTTTSENQIVVKVSISEDAATGTRSVTATHPDGGSITFANGLTITAAPEVDSISRSTIGRGATARTITLTGSGFQEGLSITVEDLTVTEATRVSATSATFKLTVPTDADLGPRDVTVINPDGGSGTLSPGITVTTGPTVTEVTPSSANRGQTVNISIEGSGFNTLGVNPVVVSFGANSGIVVNSIVAVTPDSITAQITVDPAAAGGLRVVTVTNQNDFGSGSCAAPGCFGVNTITTANAATHNTAPSHTFTINKPLGGLSMSSTVTLIRNGAQPGEPTITGQVVSVTNGTSMQVEVVPYLAGPGSYNVQVDTGGVADSCTECFSVVGGTPTLQDLTPNTAAKGAPALSVTVTGTNLSRGGRLVFKTGPTASAPDTDKVSVVPGSIAVGSTTQLTAKLQVASDATGTYYMFYDDDSTGTAGGPVGCPALESANCALTIVDPPTFANTNPVSPSSRGQGAQNTTITVTGNNFDTGSTLDFGQGVTVHANSYIYNIDSSTPTAPDTISVAITVAGNAQPGSRNVTVTTGGGGQATCTACFTVTSAPSLQSVNPSVGRTGTSVPVELTGTNFAGPMNNDSIFAGPGISVAEVTFVSSTRITATFNIAADATVGPRDVTVTNPDRGTSTANNAFRVIKLPGAPGTPSATPGDEKVTLTWTPAAANGGSVSYTVVCTPACPTSVVTTATTVTIPNLTNGTSYRFRVFATNEAGAGPSSGQSSPVTPIGPEGEFIPVQPYRVFDTRKGNAPRMGWGTSDIRTVKITGTGPAGGPDVVPDDGVSAVVLNVTAVKPSKTGNVKVYPANGGVPTTATVAYRAGDIVANLTKVNVAASGNNKGAVKVYNSPISGSGSVDVVLDVVGYFSDGEEGSPEGDRLVEAGPKRVVDTRKGIGTSQTPLAGNTVRTLDISGGTTVPKEATAVVVNLTVTGPSHDGYVTLYPAGSSRPTVSNINFVRGQTIANLAVVKLGPAGATTPGKVNAYGGYQAGNAAVILDVVGYYSESSSGTKFKGISPTRIVNTKASPSLGGSRLGPRAIGQFTIAGVGGVPTVAAGVRSVVVSVQAATPTRSGFLSVWPADENNPGTSVVNFPAGRTTLNLVVAEVDLNGRIKIYNGSTGTTDIVIDVVGFYIEQA